MSTRLMWPEQLAYLFPKRIWQALSQCPAAILGQMEEIRLRAQKPLMVQYAGKDAFISTLGDVHRVPTAPVILTIEEVQQAFEAACEHSLYAYEEEIRQGFITVKGGYRIGISGKVHVKAGEIISFPYCTGLCIRIMRELPGCANDVLAFVIEGERVYTSLIVSPPMMGKTTLLRDLARQISNGVYGSGGKRVCVVDERSELAGAVGGLAQLDIGLRTDLLDACPKSRGMMMALRALSPQVLVTDELGGEEDASAVREACFAGVKVLASAHGESERELAGRTGLQTLLTQKAFERVLILGKQPGQLQRVLNGELQPIWERVRA